MKKDLKSLNQKLPEFFLENLEQRLETDPLSIGAFMDIDDTTPDSECAENFCWTDFTICSDLSCICNHFSISA